MQIVKKFIVEGVYGSDPKKKEKNFGAEKRGAWHQRRYLEAELRTL